MLLFLSFFLRGETKLRNLISNSLTNQMNFLAWFKRLRGEGI
jgi:hypothetical protein